jgi:formate dehydrogenase iron-sulfur subunit
VIQMNKYETLPEHSHMPLVVMTVLTQVSLGGFFTLFIGDLLSLLGFNLPSPSAWMVLAVLVPSVAGLAFSALHLGHPFKAVTALINLKTSWLSREALALAVFTFGMTVVMVLYMIESSQALRVLFEAAVLGAGVYGIYAQSMIYRLEAHPSWNSSLTTWAFFSAGYIGVLLLGFTALVIGAAQIVSAILALALLAGVLHVYAYHENSRFLVLLDEKHPHYDQLNGTKTLLKDQFGIMCTVNQVLLYTGAILLPLLVTVLLASNAHTWAAIILGISMVLAVASELSERYLFFVTGVPVELP